MAISFLPKAPAATQDGKPQPTILVVPIEQVQPNDYNPNEMAVPQFNVLAEDIKAQGLDQPIVVRAVPEPKPGGPLYEIVDGEHRFKAAKLAGLAQIPVSVKEWDDEAARINTLRRNIHGVNDPKKFTALVHQMNSKSGMDLETIRAKIAVEHKQFQKLYLNATPEKDAAVQAKEAAEASAANDAKTFAVANLSKMIRDIVQQYGATIPHGFVAFQYKGETCLMVSMDKAMLRATNQLKAIIEADKLPADKTLTAVITAALKAVVSELEHGNTLAE